MLDVPSRDRAAERREATRREIVDVAWQLAQEDGLAEFTLRDVAARVGMRAPSLYTHFESKNAILDAMFAQAAQTFVDLKASLPATDDPQQDLLTEARAFISFCVSDVPRYQLLFQHSVPGFTPSAESYELAIGALEVTRELLARNGVHDPRHLDIWTAITVGLVGQQISNDPGGDRWSGLVEDVTRMFLAQFGSGGAT